MEAFGSHDWQWLNPPGHASSGPGLTFTTSPDTDFWRTTHYGFIRDTGHALGRTVTGAFTATTTFSGEYAHRYDQAGLLLRIDETAWIKTGVEYIDGEQLLSVVVTREASDWSVLPLPASTTSVTIAAERASDTVTIRYGVNGATPERMVRLAYLPPEPPVFAAVMAASPDGPGFDIRFDAFTVVA